MKLVQRCKWVLFSVTEALWALFFVLVGRARRSRARRWSSAGGQRVLLLAPHPDDEAAGCAGALALHRQSGDTVCVVYISDGRRSRALGLGADAMAQRRAAEAALCAVRLGAAPVWLGLREGEWHEAQLLEPLGAVLARFAPHLIYAPSRVDFHPEHWRVAHALALALDAECSMQHAEHTPLVRAYAVQVPLTPALANVVAAVDVDAVRGALTAHESQWGSLARTLRMRRYNGALHGLASPVEEFWELSAAQFCALHRSPIEAWPRPFRSLRPRPFSDPLAYLHGNRERHRLSNCSMQHAECGMQTSAYTAPLPAQQRDGLAEMRPASSFSLQPSAFVAPLCPDCRRPLDVSQSAIGYRLSAIGYECCACGLVFELRDGVLRLLGRRFGRELRTFTAVFSAIRQSQGKRLLAPEAYAQLPGGPATRGEHEWRLRRYDLALVRGLLRDRGPQRILDVGAWNGWLSNQLALDGHDVTAVDYFDDPYDGLGARQFYTSDWRAIQIDITCLAALNQHYDLVIVNRCLQFAADPAAFTAHANERVAPDGLLLLTGLQFFRDSRRKAAEVAKMQQAHHARYGVELFLRPTKAYLDGDDAQRLRAAGVAIRPYGRLAPANARALLNPSRPLHCYGVQLSIDKSVTTR